MLTTTEKAEIIKTWQRAKNDTGSAEVQVALLSADIAKLTEHFRGHKHDHHSRTGLHRKVNLRRKLLKYLHRIDRERYRALIKALGLRDSIAA
ncbi:MAG: 30S ribosomal protein S15 [Gammaproteobacteria bacterium]|nr:30S ribosomal protein S15 [Gammaproteobacteria bacterium]